jgi:DNA-binding protein H-NS
MAMLVDDNRLVGLRNRNVAKDRPLSPFLDILLFRNNFKYLRMATAKPSSNATFKDLQAQISALQAQAEQLRRTETGDVIAKIKEAIAYYGFNARDLGLSAARGPKPGIKASATRANAKRKATRKVFGVAKYTDGADRTWTGRGKRPQWFVDALAAGKSAEGMLIKAA